MQEAVAVSNIKVMTLFIAIWVNIMHKGLEYRYIKCDFNIKHKGVKHPFCTYEQISTL